mmetsp:Transcript_62135/g.116222  ORF Transcript_62135/g.116222 Transcript_62135/m.116222 type:complete len:351 (-) Transcript_62135:158-1210(-)
MASPLSRFWLISAVLVQAVRRGERLAGVESQDAEGSGCPCPGLSLESQFARMVAVSYDANNIRSGQSYAKDIFSCYSWSDEYYKLPDTGRIGRWLGKVKWSTPTALVGRCAMRPQMCTVAFSGATNLKAVASIPDYGPVYLQKNNQTGEIEEAFGADVATAYRFHKAYWEVYQAFRSEIGAKVMQSLHDCTEVYVTGHSIGAALASVFQWEHLDMKISQITMGQNLAWFGKPPDVGCRGRRLYSSEDPVPYLRSFVDYKDGEVIRHSAVPAQMLLYSKEGHPWTALTPDSCEADVPMDPECARGCSTLGVHYQKRILWGLASHQAFAYIDIMDAAFPPPSGPSPSAVSPS